MTARETFVLALLVIYLLREAAMHQDYESNTDAGDENDEPGEDFEYTIDFQPDEGFIAALNDDPVCPRGHIADLRESDGAIWCDACDGGTIYYQDFAGLIYPRPEAA